MIKKTKPSYKRSAKRTYWVDVITIFTVALIVAFGSYFTVKSVKKDTELELASIRQEGIIKSSNDELSGRIDNVDNDLSERIDEIGNDLSDFKFSIVNDFMTKYNTQQEDIEEINKYLSTLATKDELTAFKTNVEAEMKEVDETLFNSVMHRNIYRGKYLGTSVSTEQRLAIQNGTFDNLFVGDYWKINDRAYRIADIDYLYNVGTNGNILREHHLVIVPDANMYRARMTSSSEGDVGSYINSELRKTGLNLAKSKISTDFNNLVISYINPISNGVAVESTVELMNQYMVYGTNIFQDLERVYNQQFAMFRLNKKQICNGQEFWLTDKVTSSSFAHCSQLGRLSSLNGSEELGVRPYFLIG